MRYVTTLLLCITAFFVRAENYAVITGNIANTGTIEDSPKREIDFEMFVPHLSTQKTTKKARVIDNKFYVQLDIVEPQIIVINYLRQKTYVYLDVADSLHLSFDADAFPNNLQYSGKGGANNIVYTRFLAQFPEERSQFRIMQYKMGTVYYKVKADLDEEIQKKDPPTFRAMMDKERNAKAALFENLKREAGAVSEEFNHFMSADIHYGWAYLLMAYGHGRGFNKAIPSNFFDFLNEMLVMNPKATHSPMYLNFLTAYLNYICMEKYPDDDAFFKQIDIAVAEKVEGEPMAYFMSNLLVRALDRKSVV